MDEPEIQKQQSVNARVSKENFVHYQAAFTSNSFIFSDPISIVHPFTVKFNTTVLQEQIFIMPTNNNHTFSMESIQEMVDFLNELEDILLNEIDNFKVIEERFHEALDPSSTSSLLSMILEKNIADDVITKANNVITDFWNDLPSFIFDPDPSSQRNLMRSFLHDSTKSLGESVDKFLIFVVMWRNLNDFETSDILRHALEEVQGNVSSWVEKMKYDFNVFVAKARSEITNHFKNTINTFFFPGVDEQEFNRAHFTTQLFANVFTSHLLQGFSSISVWTMKSVSQLLRLPIFMFKRRRQSASEWSRFLGWRSSLLSPTLLPEVHQSKEDEEDAKCQRNAVTPPEWQDFSGIRLHADLQKVAERNLLYLTGATTCSWCVASRGLRETLRVARAAVESHYATSFRSILLQENAGKYSYHLEELEWLSDTLSVTLAAAPFTVVRSWLSILSQRRTKRVETPDFPNSLFQLLSQMEPQSQSYFIEMIPHFQNERDVLPLLISVLGRSFRLLKLISSSEESTKFDVTSPIRLVANPPYFPDDEIKAFNEYFHPPLKSNSTSLSSPVYDRMMALLAVLAPESNPLCTTATCLSRSQKIAQTVLQDGAVQLFLGNNALTFLRTSLKVSHPSQVVSSLPIPSTSALRTLLKALDFTLPAFRSTQESSALRTEDASSGVFESNFEQHNPSSARKQKLKIENSGSFPLVLQLVTQEFSVLSGFSNATALMSSFLFNQTVISPSSSVLLPLAALNLKKIDEREKKNTPSMIRSCIDEYFDLINDAFSHEIDPLRLIGSLSLSKALTFITLPSSLQVYLMRQFATFLSNKGLIYTRVSVSSSTSPTSSTTRTTTTAYIKVKRGLRGHQESTNKRTEKVDELEDAIPILESFPTFLESVCIPETLSSKNLPLQWLLSLMCLDFLSTTSEAVMRQLSDIEKQIFVNLNLDETLSIFPYELKVSDVQDLLKIFATDLKSSEREKFEEYEMKKIETIDHQEEWMKSTTPLHNLFDETASQESTWRLVQNKK